MSTGETPHVIRPSTQFSAPPEAKRIPPVVPMDHVRNPISVEESYPQSPQFPRISQTPHRPISQSPNSPQSPIGPPVASTSNRPVTTLFRTPFG